MGSMRGVSRKQCQHQICSFSVGRSYAFAKFGLLRFICDVEGCDVDSVNWTNLSIGRLTS